MTCQLNGKPNRESDYLPRIESVAIEVGILLLRLKDIVIAVVNRRGYCARNDRLRLTFLSAKGRRKNQETGRRGDPGYSKGNCFHGFEAAD